MLLILTPSDWQLDLFTFGTLWINQLCTEKLGMIQLHYFILVHLEVYLFDLVIWL